MLSTGITLKLYWRWQPRVEWVVAKICSLKVAESHVPLLLDASFFCATAWGQRNWASLAIQCAFLRHNLCCRFIGRWTVGFLNIKYVKITHWKVKLIKKVLNCQQQVGMSLQTISHSVKSHQRRFRNVLSALLMFLIFLILIFMYKSVKKAPQWLNLLNMHGIVAKKLEWM